MLLRRIWRTFLVLTSAVASASPTLAQTDSPATPEAGAVASPSSRVVRNVVIRSAPSTLSTPLDALEPGDVVAVVGLRPNWIGVRLGDGRQGWVSSRWVVVSAPKSTVPPSLDAAPYVLEAIDVGTGLAVLVTGPDFTLLYDGGSNDDVATGESNRLLAYLRAAHPALQRIDTLILSHPHRDHVELLVDVIERYDVKSVWDSGRTNGICGYRAFVSAISLRPAIVYHDALPGETVHDAPFPEQTCKGRRLPAVTVRIENPQLIVIGAPIALGASATMTVLAADGAPLPDVNANSVVVRLQLGARSVLLMGDAEAGGRQDPDRAPEVRSIEGRLLSCCTSEIRSDVMVVGHHGSRTSSRSSFIDAVGARDFVVSAGPTRYGSVTLPDAVIVDELASRGTVWRTDRDDPACAVDAHKIGLDADGEPGGCDNVRLRIGDDGVQGSYFRPAD
jgi:beta-lactamase superfamily II metal-dependent hydrolase